MQGVVGHSEDAASAEKGPSLNEVDRRSVLAKTVLENGIPDKRHGSVIASDGNGSSQGKGDIFVKKLSHKLARGDTSEHIGQRCPVENTAHF